MINGKTYYQILGVLEDAEDIVIRAAYKVLAQKYHPDKWSGSKEEATQRMSEINQAYAVLSDRLKRVEYDKTSNSKEYQESQNEDEYSEDSIDTDWNQATEYFPDLKTIALSLKKISQSLERTYKFIILEKKLFSERAELALTLEHNYLVRYFGTNPEVVTFAKFCINVGKQNAAKEINRAVNLLGSNVDPSVIIDKIVQRYVPEYRKETRLCFDFLTKCKTQDVSFEECEDFFYKLGAVIERNGLLSFTYNISYNKEKRYDLIALDLKRYAKEIAQDIVSKNQSR